MRSRTSLRPMGSSPLMGSSRTTKDGSPTSACAMPSRCCMPFEYLRICRSAASVSPTSSSSSPDAARHGRRRRRRRARPKKRERLAAGQELVVRGVLGQVADAPLRLRRRDGRVVDEGPSRGGEDEPHEHLDGGGLPGAVRPDEAEDLPVLHGQVEVLHGLDALAADARPRRSWRASRCAGWCCAHAGRMIFRNEPGVKTWTTRAGVTENVTAARGGVPLAVRSTLTHIRDFAGLRGPGAWHCRC